MREEAYKSNVEKQDGAMTGEKNVARKGGWVKKNNSFVQFVFRFPTYRNIGEGSVLTS